VYPRLFQTLLTVILALTRVAAYAGNQPISGSVTSRDGSAIAGAVVFVQTPSPSTVRPRTMAVVDQVNKTFVPGVLPITVGTSVRFPNHDQIHHHVYSFSPTKTFELPLYKGDDAPPVVFDKVGVVKIACNIHDWMSGIILVVPTPYFSVTGADGRFVLEDLPSGTYVLVAWHALSTVKPEETAQTVQVPGAVSNINFSLSLSPPRPRPVMHGLRPEP
jgi:plastocyanin